MALDLCTAYAKLCCETKDMMSSAMSHQMQMLVFHISDGVQKIFVVASGRESSEKVRSVCFGALVQ